MLDVMTRRCWRRGFALLAVLGVAVVAAAPVDAGPGEGVSVLEVDGRGFGHGVGMAQEGAHAMGAAGSTTVEILGQFYPGTILGQGTGQVRVPVFTAPLGSASVSFPAGGEIRSSTTGAEAAGFPLQVGPGGSVTVRYDGSFRASLGSAGTVVADQPATPEPDPSAGPASPGAPPDELATSNEVSSPSPVFAVPAEGSTVALDGRSARYRGLLEITAAGDRLRLVNRLDVEEYLRGMGEVRDGRWPAAALGAQAVAARTYALRAMTTGDEICPTQRCQVYLGQQAEYPAMDEAVATTRGQVLLHGDELASTVYSANGGGVTATPTEGFGPAASDVPYLRSAPYPTQDPDAWQARVSLGDVAARLGYPGSLRSVQVSAVGPSGRATVVELGGDAGARTVTGRAFARALGLRSTLWSLSVESGEPAPPPAAPEQLQVPPSEASAEEPPVTVAPPAADDRALDERAAVASALGSSGPDSGGSDDVGRWWWAVYGVIFLVTAFRRDLQSLWGRSR
jgi:stage II sporulation protein D